MWRWSDAEQAQKYRQHQQSVDALATQAGLSCPWVLDEFERSRGRCGGVATA
jgi:hypothetical protein